VGQAIGVSLALAAGVALSPVPIIAVVERADRQATSSPVAGDVGGEHAEDDPFCRP
jgi:hypothetical protein